MNTGAVENSFCPILVPNRTKLCFQALQKIKSILFVFPPGSKAKQWQRGSKGWLSHDAKALECTPWRITTIPANHSTPHSQDSKTYGKIPQTFCVNVQSSSVCNSCFSWARLKKWKKHREIKKQVFGSYNMIRVNSSPLKSAKSHSSVREGKLWTCFHYIRFSFLCIN